MTSRDTWGLAVAAVAIALAAGGASPAGAQGFEAPPVLRAADLAPAGLLQGPSHRVDDRVPTDGLLARFTVRSDFGAFEAAGPGMLRVRVGEARALAELDKMSKSEVFANAMAEAAKRTGRSLQAIVENPAETVAGIPEGVGRFFDRVGRATKTGVQKGQEQLAQKKAEGSGGGDTAAMAATGAGRATGEALGYYDARRRLAKELGVDPYTTNPVLAKKLDEVAWAAFAGDFGFKGVTSAVPGLGMVTFTSNVVWDTPAGDLQVMIEKKLLAMGVPQDGVDRFLRHPHFTLTLQTALVTDLEALGSVPGRAEVLPLALGATSEEQARFVVGAVAILARHHRTVAPIARVRVAGTVLATARDGALVVPAPVDYVAWTKRAATFARRTDLKAPARGLWLPGQVSPLARKELVALGWTVREGFTDEPAAPR